MNIQFLGATQTVTGSKYLVTSGDTRILVDCGLFQGLKELRLRNWDKLPIPPESVDAVILTHAHIDHTGYLPLLVKNGFKGPIYCSGATRDLCKLLLPDSGRLQEEAASHANLHGYSKHHPARPLYTQEDAFKALRQFKPIPIESDFQLPGELSCSLLPSGHILGSTFIRISDSKATLTFSGDLGRPNDLVLKPPKWIQETDYLVIESTYGNKIHPKDDVLTRLADSFNKTFERGGTVIVPAFAVGRTQTLLYCIYRLKAEKRIADVPVFLNSPMAVSASQLFCSHEPSLALNSNETKGTCTIAHYVSSPKESQSLNARKGPMIIISASGMATGGRVLHHLEAFGPHERNLILFTGFQAAGTRGDRLMRGERLLKIHGQMVPIKAEISQINGLSGHADQAEIMQWLSHFKKAPKHTFVTHGEPESAEVMRSLITSELGWNASVPQYLQKVSLP